MRAAELTEHAPDFVGRWQSETARLAREGLYDPAEERDSCGVGLVVAIDGVPVRGVDDMHRLLTGERIGRRAELAVVRGGEERAVAVTPRELV